MVNKTTDYSDEEITGKVIELVGAIVMMNPGEIAVNSSLIDDLGMESIDFVDIVFRLEKTFGISIPRTNPIQLLGEEEVLKDGKLTQKGIKIFKLTFPGIHASRVCEAIKDDTIASLLTVHTYVNIVKRGLEIARWEPELCDKCGAVDFVPADKDKLEFPNDIVPLGPVFLCKSCDNMMIAPSFDDPLYEQISE